MLIYLLVFAFVTVSFLIIFSKKCITYLDKDGNRSGGCFWIWEKGYWGAREKEKYNVVQTKTFSEISGFSFQYPEFKGWEVDYVEKVSSDEFVIYFNNPNTVAFEYPPSMRVVKDNYSYSGPNGSKIENNPNIKTSQNNVKYYASYENPAENKDVLPYVNFYADKFIITVRPFMHEGDGYSGRAMADKIIETFKFE